MLTLVQEGKRTIRKRDVPSNKIFEHGAFAGALPAHYGDLRQVEGTPQADRRKGILQLVHDGYEIFHAMVTHLKSSVSAPIV